MSVGDVILVRAAPGNPVDWSITHLTNGPYVHVEVDVGMGQSVGALTKGITLHAIPQGSHVEIVPMAGRLDKKRALKAALWARKEVHRGNYGFTDIVMALWRKLKFAVSFSVNGRMDCSHLVAGYLMLAGFDFPSDWLMDTAAISPNDIARALSVLPRPIK